LLVSRRYAEQSQTWSHLYIQNHKPGTPGYETLRPFLMEPPHPMFGFIAFNLTVLPQHFYFFSGNIQRTKTAQKLKRIDNVAHNIVFRPLIFDKEKPKKAKRTITNDITHKFNSHLCFGMIFLTPMLEKKL
jgi:hypothetical protein